jgi:hypothetical protein
MPTQGRQSPMGMGAEPAAGASDRRPQSRLGNSAALQTASVPASTPRPAQAPFGLGNAAAVRAAGASVGPTVADGSAAVPVSRSSVPAVAACEHPLPDRQLFDQLQQTWPLFGLSIDVPLWRGRADIGWLGWIDFSVLAGAGAEASLWTSLGPGQLRDICLGGDPAQACVTGTGTLHVAADLAPAPRMEGTLRGAADYLGSIPLAVLSGALVAVGTGTAHTDLAMAVTITYADGKVSLDTDTDLSLAVALGFALDASLIAELFGEELFAGRWNLVDRRWSRDWDLLGRVTFGVRSDVLTDPWFDVQAGDLLLDEVLRWLFEGLLVADEIVSGFRGASVAAAVPMLDPLVVATARAAIEASDYPLALDIVVRGLPIDPSLFTISFVDRDDEGEGLTHTRFLPDNTPRGPSTVTIYTPAFSSVQWLVTSVMHEYQHVLQHQAGREPGETTSAAARALGREARETEAYLWELEHAEETGIIAQHGNLRDTGARLMQHFVALGALDRERQENYRERVDAALLIVDDVVGVMAPDLPPFANAFHHGTDYDTAERLGTVDIGAIGGNDFGRGFYTHSRENWVLAKEWAIRVSRGKRGWGVVSFPVPDDVWEEEVFEVMIFEHPRHQPDNIPINPDTGRKFRDWAEFVRYNKRFRRDRLPEWPELQVITGPLWGRYQNDPKVRQVVFTSSGVPVLNRPESKQHRIVHVRVFHARAARHAP